MGSHGRALSSGVMDMIYDSPLVAEQKRQWVGWHIEIDPLGNRRGHVAMWPLTCGDFALITFTITMPRTFSQDLYMAGYSFYYWFFFEREEKHQFVVPLIYVFIGCFLCVPWLGKKPKILVYPDNVLTNWGTWPGQAFCCSDLTGWSPWMLEDARNEVEIVPDPVCGWDTEVTTMEVKEGGKCLEWGWWTGRWGASELQFSPRSGNLGTMLRNTSLEIKRKHSDVKLAWDGFQLLARTGHTASTNWSWERGFCGLALNWSKIHTHKINLFF